MSCKDLGAVTEMGKPRLLHAMSIRADIGPAIEFATSQGTTRAIFPIEGGVVQGDGLAGRILPGGADFARLLPDGSYAIEARYCIKFDEGTTVMIGTDVSPTRWYLSRSHPSRVRGAVRTLRMVGG
ncbi:MAG: DUF3237 family protein [Sulfitobacter sp.]|nr:DUF3237 family protein [Sulfitobacter sp.]